MLSARKTVLRVFRDGAIGRFREHVVGDRRRLIGVIMGLSYGSGWAVCTVWLRRIMTVYPVHPTGVIFWRDLIVSAALFTILFMPRQIRGTICRRRGLRLRRQHIPLLVVFGFVGIALNNASWGLSVSLNGVTVATVLAYSAPIFTVLLSRPLYGERITRRKLTSLVLALSGCLLVSQIYDLGNTKLLPFGMAMAVSVGLTQAARDLIGKKIGGLYPALTGLFYGFLFGTVFLGLGLVTQDIWPRLPLQGWVELVVMSLGIMASYALYLGALARLPVSVASILGLSEAAVAAFLAYLVHGEMLAPLQLLGAILVISGVAVLEVRDD